MEPARALRAACDAMYDTYSAAHTALGWSAPTPPDA